VNLIPLFRQGNTRLRVSETMQNAVGDCNRLVNTELQGANCMGSKPVDTGPNVLAAVYTERRFQSIDLFFVEVRLSGSVLFHRIYVATEN
jgi:hypothetical protein